MIGLPFYRPARGWSSLEHSGTFANMSVRAVRRRSAVRRDANATPLDAAVEPLVAGKR
jgi:hypothetical protein